MSKYIVNACSLLLLCCMFFTKISAQTITPVLVPKYIYGNGSDGGNMPFAFRAKISGLKANATYKYVNFALSPGSLKTSNGLGAFLVPSETSPFTRFRTVAMSGTNGGSFKVDADGNYTGWFVLEASGTSLYAPATYPKLLLQVCLNDGGTGTTVATRLYLDKDTIYVTKYGTAPENGTGISGVSEAAFDKNFVMLYDNNEGAGRPVAGTFIENEGVDVSTITSTSQAWDAYYVANVNNKSKAWAALIPNTLPNGIRKIVQYRISDGAEIGSNTSADGTWPAAGGGTVSTVNPSGGGTSYIVLDGSKTALNQAITFDALSAKTWGDADFALQASTPLGLPVAFTSSDPAVAVVNNNIVHITGAGTTTITASQPGNSTYMAANLVEQVLTVNKATLTITAEDQTRLLVDPDPAFTFAYTGFVNNDAPATLSALPVATTTATASSPMGTYPIIPAGATSANYNITYVNGTLTIIEKRQDQQITFNSLPAKIYGDADLSAGATINSTLKIQYTSSDPAVATIGATGMIHITGNGTTTITAAQSGNAAFNAAASVMQVLTVNKAALTIKADNQKKMIGQPNAALTITWTGFVYNEDKSVLKVQPVIATTATTASAVGDYPITVSGATADNYTITHVNGTLTVDPLPAQTITWTTLSVKKYGDEDITLTATAGSGLPVTYTSSDPSVATVINGVVHILKAGTTNITAAQGGNEVNAPAPSVTQTFTVQQRAIRVMADDLTKEKGAANPPLTFHYEGFVNGETQAVITEQATISTTATLLSIPGRYDINVAGGAAANYRFVYVQGYLTVTRPVTDTLDEVHAHLSVPGKLRVLYFAKAATKEVTVRLIDVNGTRHINAVVDAVAGANTWYYNVSGLAAGIYPLTVQANGQLYKTKVIIR